MWARTIPLPKNDQFVPWATRPITILPTIYRLWSKVCTRAILHRLSMAAPKAIVGIVGMIPKRGAMDASYNLQALLEKFRHQQKEVAGITLDLRKCFNLVDRPRAKKTLEKYDIPAVWVEKWFKSLENMKRFWHIGDAVSALVDADAGIPEGDPWSVVIMILIAIEWYEGLGLTQQDDGAAAYADNWTCWRTSDSDPAQMIHHTLQTTLVYGLQIDWGKTWVWSTTTKGHASLEKAIHDQIPDAQPCVKNCAKDLGCHVTYHGNPRLGSVHERLQRAKDRLDRIRKQTWDYLVKIQIILASVIPVAFYGAELIYLGEQHLDSLRTQIAHSIVGEKLRSMNPAIFIHCATLRPLDPLLVLILQALKAAMKFLRNTSDENKWWFLKILSQPLKNSHAVWGPASALREYLLKVGWTCSKDGLIQVSNNHKCHLLKPSFQVKKSIWKLHGGKTSSCSTQIVISSLTEDLLTR